MRCQPLRRALCVLRGFRVVFDKKDVEKKLQQAFEQNSEHELLSILKANSFLFYDLYDRKWGIRPNFAEVPFGSKYRCDFCWLNDNSDGPEWVLVEIEKPKVKLFKQDGEPTSQLNHALEQVRSWDRYFSTNPNEKTRIFGSVARFRFVLVIGEKDDWGNNQAAVWKSHNNANTNIEIRSMDTFFKSLQRYKEEPEHLSFEHHPKSLKSSELSEYCSNDPYLCGWKLRLTSNT
nr:Shedu anti-phage system protein SduA domain-containing protein [Vibrio cholerae]